MSSLASVDDFLSKALQWQVEMTELRRILLDCHLTEAIKWGQPCYTFRKKNILLIGNFKNYCTLSFFKGVLLKDDANILHTPGENSQSVRMVKFTDVKAIIAKEAELKIYIYEAIKIEKAGLKVEFKGPSELVLPAELLEEFNKDKAFEIAFKALTPGRQRGYCLNFNAPKQTETRKTRVIKYKQRIFDGYGIHDCTCGASQKMPRCDGSHKSLNE